MNHEFLEVDFERTIANNPAEADKHSVFMNREYVEAVCQGQGNQIFVEGIPSD